MFDTFDCKIARYLGFGPTLNVATIAKLILAYYFTGPIGIYFAVMTMIFGFYMIVIAFRAIHIFLTSAFAIVLMVYVSPITITCCLFKKTEGIFNRWLVQLIGFSLQPIILFAYMGLFVTIFETVVSGSATFAGKAPTRELICDKICVDPDGNKSVFTISKDCDPDKGYTILDPMSDSVACMINLKNDKFKHIPVLEPLGIALPMIANLFTENGRQKILTMLKAALIIYILSSFMSEIPGIASNLMGGNKLPDDNRASVEKMFKATAGAGTAIQERAAKGLIKAAGKGKDSIKDTIKKIGEGDKNPGG